MKLIRFFTTLFAVVLVLQTAVAQTVPFELRKIQGHFYKRFVGQTIKDRSGKAYFIDSYLGAGSYAQVFKVRDTLTGAFYALRLYNDIVLDTEALKVIKENNDYNKVLPIPGVLKIFAHGNFEVSEIGVKKAYGTITELAIGNAKQHPDFDLARSETNFEFLKRLHNLEKLMVFGMTTIENLRTTHNIHRDIKPTNILIMPDGTYRFGDSDFVGPAARWFVGTHHYMPPEVLHGTSPSYRSDLFSFGLTMAELMIGTQIGVNDDYKKFKKLRYVDYDSLMQYKSNWSTTLEYIEYELDKVIDMHQNIAIRERLIGLKHDILDLMSEDISARESVKENYLPMRKSCGALF